MISMTRCKIVTITASWTSSRFFSSFSSDASFLSQVALVSQERSHFEKRPDHEYAHLHGAWTIQHVCSHDCTVFSKNRR